MNPNRIRPTRSTRHLPSNTRSNFSPSQQANRPFTRFRKHNLRTKSTNLLNYRRRLRIRNRTLLARIQRRLNRNIAPRRLTTNLHINSTRIRRHNRRNSRTPQSSLTRQANYKLQANRMLINMRSLRIIHLHPLRVIARMNQISITIDVRRTGMLAPNL